MQLKNPHKHRDIVERLNGCIEFRDNRLTLKLSNQPAQNHEENNLGNKIAWLNPQANQAEPSTAKLSSFERSIRANNERNKVEDLRKKKNSLPKKSKDKPK